VTTPVKPPNGLDVKGRKLWRDLQKDNDFDPAQTIILEEICRIADRLEGLNDAIQGKGIIRLLHMRMPGTVSDEGVATINLTVDGVMSEARQQAHVMKQLIVSLRLPDEATGKKPQARGARGAYSKGSAASTSSVGSTGNARVSSMDRARQRASGVK
jgi:hypothetical protein